MKKYAILLSVLFISTAISAQLDNTIWFGAIKGDNPRPAYLDFTKNQCILYASDKSPIEAMSLSVSGNTFSIKKISGHSDCDNIIVGKYEFRIKKDSLFIKTVDDICDDRSSALDGTVFIKSKKEPPVKVDVSILKSYAGIYELDAQHQISMLFENGSLYAESVTNKIPKSLLNAKNATTFTLPVASIDLTFVNDTNGKVVKFIAHADQEYEFKKIK